MLGKYCRVRNAIKVRPEAIVGRLVMSRSVKRTSVTDLSSGYHFNSSKLQDVSVQMCALTGSSTAKNIEVGEAVCKPCRN